MKRIASIGFALAMFSALSLRGQVVIQEDYLITTGFEPKLAEMEKFKNQPAILDTFQARPDSVYFLNTRPVAVNYYPDTLQAVKMKNEPISKLRRFYAKLGFGNYLSPYADVQISSLRSKSDAYNFRYTHFSSHGIISGVGSPWLSDNEGSASYNHYFKTHTIQLDAKYTRNVVHFYGYDANVDSLFTRDTVRQRFNRGDFKAELFSNYRTDSIRINHTANLTFQHWDDKYGSSENTVGLGGNINRFTDWFAGETIGANLDMAYRQYKTDSTGAQHGFFLNITPYLNFGGKNWGLHLGVKLALGADDSTRFNVYPDVNFHVNIFRKYIRFYVDATGQYKRHSLYDLTVVNPFIRPSTQLKNLNEYVRGRAGFKGAFTDNVSYNAGAEVSYAKNLVFFANDTVNPVQKGFEVLYDQGINFRAFGELSVVFGEKLKVTGGINYNLWKPENIRTAYHKPFLDGFISGRYSLRNKLIFTADIYFISPQTARIYAEDTLNPGTTVEQDFQLKGLIDANIGIEYRFRPWLSVWANVNNIAATRYNRWYQYPTQGLNVMGGLSVAF